MNWFEKLFGKKKEIKKVIDSTKYPSIETVLNDKQKEKANSFYYHNKEHIEKIIKAVEKPYEPSESEDKNDPRIWKAEYWKWFLIMRHLH